MRILIINTDYHEFMMNLYSQYPKLHEKPYQEQMDIRNSTLFGSADFYSHHLNQLGHQAIDVHYNNVKMQSKWEQENIRGGKSIRKTKEVWHHLSNTKLGRLLRHKICSTIKSPFLNYLDHILKAQISAFNPDIILNQSLVEVPADLLRKIKNRNSQLIGQIASPLPEDNVLKCYDLLISSLPNQVEKFYSLGIPAAYIKLGFDERLLTTVSEVPRDLGTVFVGSITNAHQNRVKLLEYLCEKINIKIWGTIHGLPKSSPIYKCYQGEAWGIDMYKIFRRAKIVLNNHIDLSEDYANNMRLFEVTGSGAMLLTDQKINLNEIYEINSEAVTYSSFDECHSKIEYYLTNEDARIEIALAGQKRTLKDHLYSVRVQEMVRVFNQESIDG
jgi:spore maturation protein CgeB